MNARAGRRASGWIGAVCLALILFVFALSYR